ncbi:MAG TPA: M23 family metallopeptidase [Leptolyngbyaceae cyanobacterium M33_DOE_097]|uniref:M23 family metallopeptidase n=1 Tax=Oscillatoriales cyanobacterium SpSt-418 TaxID=2282169 RepID=A0A7C3KBU2_9CYAN|nr:M23 family metallopeptidase [Leptolyngbyaceae cyanobacterium M33_DOE_097]
MKPQNQPPVKPSHEVTRSLVIKSASILSLLGVFSSSAVLAQAIDAIGDMPPVESAPAPEVAPASAPAPVEVAPAPAPVAPTRKLQSQEVYIDPTPYSLGATERYTPRATPEVPSRYAGTPQFSSGQSYRGRSNTNWTTYTASPSSVVRPGQTTSSGRNYYKTRDFDYRTYRPPVQIGNGNIRLIFPLAIPAPITSLFGWRIHPVTGESRFHTGTDLGAPLGTPVLAALAGQVAIADWLGGYGLTVTLQHNKGTQETLYAHLSEVFVKPGETVKQGDVIGRVGSTGLSTGPHLHFEFRQQTPDGWVALDAGAQLEYGLAQLVKAMQAADSKPQKSRS